MSIEEMIQNNTPVTRAEFEQLRQFVLSMDSRYNREKEYNSADKMGIRQTEGNHGIAIDENTQGISENDGAICDVAELSDVNSQAIDDLAEMVDELSNKVDAMEG